MCVVEQVCAGSAVVVVDDRIGETVPAAAVPILRQAAQVYAEAGLSAETRESLRAPLPPETDELLEQASREAVVLVVGQFGSERAEQVRRAGAQVVAHSPPPGAELLDAVHVMDLLRSPGSCPWDAEQSHDSLRTYLVEETYELLDAIEQRDREALREELGDVLLQVLFHARVATEHESEPFGIDEVASALVSKLVSRHPHVFAGGESLGDSESQQLRWDELKRREKQRESLADGVAFGQPAVALAAKLAQRARRADVPEDLLPQGDSIGETLFATAAAATLAGFDPEDELRSCARAFDERLRAAESAAREQGRDSSRLTAERWRLLWPENGTRTPDF